MNRTPSSNGFGVVDCYKLYGYNWDQCGYCRGERSAFYKQQQLIPTTSTTKNNDDNIPHQPQEQQQQQQQQQQQAVSTPAVPAASQSYRSYLAKIDSPMRPSTYETLMCRGWRRSGTILYLPDNATTCCPQHTIRLPIADFALNKEQKKVLRKMQSLLQGKPKSNIGKRQKQYRNDTVMAILVRKGVLASLVKETETLLASLLPESIGKEKIPQVRYKLQGLTNHGSNNMSASLSCPVCTVLVARKTIDKTFVADLANRLVQKLQSSQHLSSIVSSISSTTAGILRVQVDLVDENDVIQTDRRLTDPLEEWFQSKGMTVPVERTIQVHTLPATESAATDRRVHQLYWDYQETVHGDYHPLNSTTILAAATNESASVITVDERARPMLEQAYGNTASGRLLQQAFVNFWDFLVDSPLGSSSSSSSTIHQWYTIGDALVAVGVLDILPTGISSVYCFYDPTFAKLVPLGTYTSLQEIEYTRSLQLPYYYLGYYIESNPKMNYKGEYIGSQLRCSVTGEWVAVDEARKVLRRDERAQFGSNNNNQPNVPRPAHQQMDVGKLPILTNQGIIYGHSLQDEDKAYLFPFLEEWVTLAGPDIARIGTVDVTES